MEREDSFLNALANQALTHYPIQVEQIIPLRRSDNITFRIEAKDGCTFLLRIHYSSLAEVESCRQKREGILSELAWLTSLSDCGFNVQRPLRAHSGEPVLEA